MLRRISLGLCTLLVLMGLLTTDVYPYSTSGGETPTIAGPIEPPSYP